MPFSPFLGMSGSPGLLLISVPLGLLFVLWINHRQKTHPLSPKAVTLLVLVFIMVVSSLFFFLDR